MHKMTRCKICNKNEAKEKCYQCQIKVCPKCFLYENHKIVCITCFSDKEGLNVT